MPQGGRLLEKALRRLRARFLAAAALEGVVGGLSAGFAVFLAGVTLHVFGGLSYGMRVSAEVAAAVAFFCVFAGVFWYRGCRRASLAGLAVLAENESSWYGGELVAAAEILKSPSESRDALAQALIGDAERLVLERPPRIEYRPSNLLIKAAVAVFLAGPLVPFTAGPGHFALAVIDCLFPERDALFKAVARFEGMEPGGGEVPAGHPVELTVGYFGWPPRSVDLRIKDSSGVRVLTLEKARPGVFTARTVFRQGEVSLRPRAEVPVIEGTRELVGDEVYLRAVPVAQLVALSQRIDLPFPDTNPILAGGGDVVAPVGAKVTLTATADVPLESLVVRGVTAEDMVIDGAVARFCFLVKDAASYSLQPVPVDGYAGEKSSFRIVPAQDAPPVVTTALVDGDIRVVVSDDWGIGRVYLKLEPPEGGLREIDLYEGGGRSLKRTLPVEEFVSGGKGGRYLVQAVAMDIAKPDPHVVKGPLLSIEYTPPEEEDPLLASLPGRPQRHLSFPPPETQPVLPSRKEEQPGGSKRPPESAEEGGRRLESLGGAGSAGGEEDSRTGGRPEEEDGGAPPRYAGMPGVPQSSKEEKPPEKSSGPGGSEAGTQGGGMTPPSAPEGGMAGKSEKTGSGGSGSPGESGGIGRPSDGAGGRPVDGGRPTGNETGPTPVFKEDVDIERVESLDVSPDEIADMKLRIPADTGSGPEGEEVKRTISTRFGGGHLSTLQLERVPEVYRTVVRVYWEKAAARDGAP